ncbi:MAG: hypothetical protein C0408_00165 [Odoribacter sp.]|nr:hypothetical protein [Odoribacter sp.]
MSELNLKDIEQISRDIRREEITFSHLPDELIDHVCCDVESEMKRGLSFSEAYFSVKEKLGPRRLKEIQEETLFEVDTKYRNMKNTMKISGIKGTMMLGFAAVFKILHLPGAGILMTLGALLLALIFMPSALVVLWKETRSGKRLFLFVAAFLTGSTFIMGILFKTQHWPAAGILISLSILFAILFFLPSLLFSKLVDTENVSKRPVYILGFIGMAFYLAGFWFKMLHWPLATILMSIGSFLIMVVVLPWYTWITWKEEKQVSAKFIFMVIAIVLFIMPGALVNLGFQKTYDDEFFVHQDQQQAMLNYRGNTNESLLSAYKDSVQYQKMEQIHLKTAALIDQINRLELKMMELAAGKTGITVANHPTRSGDAVNTGIKYRNITGPFNINPVKYMLLPGTESRNELDKELLGYRAFISLNTNETWRKNYEPLISPSSYLPDENPFNGEFALISGLHALTLLKNGILLTETSVLKQIAID